MSSSAETFCDCPLLEGVVTTSNDDGSTNISPMGPRVDWPTTRLLLRPFQSSMTYRNLHRTRRGILHVTDDVLLIARAAMGCLSANTLLVDGPEGYGKRLADCVRWYAFDVDSLDDSQDRTEIVCHVADEGSVRDFFGFNRARHAVIEAAILATRLHLIPMENVLDDFSRYTEIVEKTAGEQERQAFCELQQFVTDRFGEAETKIVFDR
ncbi:MAG: DUF447 domain-containing protein [Aeoliella sp.]